MNTQITAEKLIALAESLKAKREKLVDAIIIVKDRYDEIRKHLFDQATGHTAYGIPIHVVADDTAATMRMLDCNQQGLNRVVVVYQDTMVEANLALLRSYGVSKLYDAQTP